VYKLKKVTFGDNEVLRGSFLNLSYILKFDYAEVDYVKLFVPNKADGINFDGMSENLRIRIDQEEYIWEILADSVYLILGLDRIYQISMENTETEKDLIDILKIMESVLGKDRCKAKNYKYEAWDYIIGYEDGMVSNNGIYINSLGTLDMLEHRIELKEGVATLHGRKMSYTVMEVFAELHEWLSEDATHQFEELVYEMLKGSCELTAEQVRNLCLLLDSWTFVMMLITEEGEKVSLCFNEVSGRMYIAKGW